MWREDKIKERVAGKRKRFFLKAFIYLAIILTSVMLLLITDDTTAVFIATLLIILFCYSLIKLVVRSELNVLFSGEKRGINIKEHEFCMRTREAYSRYFGFYKTKNSWRANAVHSLVYIRLDDGNVVCISGLYKRHTDIYNEGDELLKYPGCRYPVVVSRSDANPICPICGTVNVRDTRKCINCGLEAE